MADELVLKPVEFQEEIDNYESENKKIAEIEYAIEGGELSLDSFDGITECVNTWNRMLQKLNTLGACDVQNMQNIKSAWMNLDEEIGSKTFGEYLFPAPEEEES